MKFALVRPSLVTLAAASLLGMAACGGSGNGGGNNSSGNRAPVANAGSDQNVAELSAVTLAGSGSDADNDVLTFSWLQTAGTAVTLDDSASATPGFTAPDVAAGEPEVLTFELTVNDGSVSASDAVNITVEEPLPAVTVAGTVSYEFVPPNNNCNGLNFGNTVARPIRGAPVQLIDAASSAVLSTTTADDNGDYSFSGVAANTQVRLRVRAELEKTSGTSRWDVEVRDNYDPDGARQLSQRPLYVVEGASFDSGASAVRVQDLTATTGWGGSAYTGDRAAAPFAILDTIYTGIRFIEAADSNVVFPPLDVFWSVNNTVSASGDLDRGELGTSFYQSGVRQLFLLGEASSDTEEFDDHVVMHEWGHFFEDAFSRSDSIGGTHAIGEPLDARLAFGEGWASAFAAIVLDDPIYCDTGAVGTSAGFGLDTESDMIGIPGWFNEWNVATFVYDLWDTNTDGSDTGSVGWDPIYATMTGSQANTEAFTSVFTFASGLRDAVGVIGDTLIDSQLARYDIVSGANLDIWATNESNDYNGTQDVLPLYLDVVADGTVYDICVNSSLDGLDRHGNNIGEDRLLRLAIPVTDAYDVTIATTTVLPPDDPMDDRDQSDPDMYIYQGPNLVAAGTSPEANLEEFSTGILQQGTTYIAYLEEWRFEDEQSPLDYSERICFDVSFAP